MDYYVNGVDNTGIHLVTMELTGDNYHTWRRSMTMALSAKRKLGFVNGTILEPSDQSSPLYERWQIICLQKLMPVLSTLT